MSVRVDPKQTIAIAPGKPLKVRAAPTSSAIVICTTTKTDSPDPYAAPSLRVLRGMRASGMMGVNNSDRATT
eukprot:6696805-Prymnesium_polylepis.1